MLIKHLWRGMPFIAALAVSCVVDSSMPALSQPNSPANATHSPADRADSWSSVQRPPGRQQCQRTFAGVAHQDDDLLFMNPELEDTIRAGCPVSTAYLTAGDAGEDLDYVTSRENGVRAAYAAMADVPNSWTEHDLTVNGRRLASFTLDGNVTVRLTFLRLPDGFPAGEGTPAYNQESLLKLFRGEINAIHRVDNAQDTGYTGAQLVATLTALIKQTNAERVLTLDYDNTSFGYGVDGTVDHSDHGISARYFRDAASQVDPRLSVRPYLGYNMSQMAPNLAPQQVTEKTRVFNEYNRMEGCYGADLNDCAERPLGNDYANWVTKQYPKEEKSASSATRPTDKS